MKNPDRHKEFFERYPEEMNKLLDADQREQAMYYLDKIIEEQQACNSCDDDYCEHTCWKLWLLMLLRALGTESESIEQVMQMPAEICKHVYKEIMNYIDHTDPQGAIIVEVNLQQLDERWQQEMNKRRGAAVDLTFFDMEKE